MNTAQCAMNWTGDTSQQQPISIIQMKKQIKHKEKFLNNIKVDMQNRKI